MLKAKIGNILKPINFDSITSPKLDDGIEVDVTFPKQMAFVAKLDRGTAFRGTLHKAEGATISLRQFLEPANFDNYIVPKVYIKLQNGDAYGLRLQPDPERSTHQQFSLVNFDLRNHIGLFVPNKQPLELTIGKSFPFIYEDSSPIKEILVCDRQEQGPARPEVPQTPILKFFPRKKR